MSGHEPALAACYAAFLGLCAAALERSARSLARESAPDGGELPWPHSDAVALRRVMAATLLVLAVFVLAAALARGYWFPSA